MHASLRPLVYFAAPLFSEAELSFNDALALKLERFVDVFLPQRDGGKVVDLVDRGVTIRNAYSSIFDRDVEAIRQANAVFAVLDGRVVDEGVAFELGLAFAMGKTCVGFQSDSRRLLPIGNNPMIECALASIFKNQSGVLDWARTYSESWSSRAVQHPA